MYYVDHIILLKLICFAIYEHNFIWYLFILFYQNLFPSPVSNMHFGWSFYISFKYSSMLLTKLMFAIVYRISCCVVFFVMKLHPLSQWNDYTILYQLPWFLFVIAHDLSCRESQGVQSHYPHVKTITASTSWWCYPFGKNIKYIRIHGIFINVKYL